jgi:stage II sporulation protein AA (anti-sigma F factor antagonist)
MRERASHPSDGRLPCFSVERIDLGDEVILSLRGEFDLSGVGAFNSAVPAAAPEKSVILDLRRLSFLDSSGLQAIINLHRRAGTEGWSLLLKGPQRQVVRLLQLTGADQHLTLVEKHQLDATR